MIVKKDGSTIVCRVVELTSTEITYKKWSDLNGSNYVMDCSLASAINYENGKKVKLSEVTNLYKPNNQNDGVQQYNDKALLALDAATKGDPLKKARNLKTIGWVGGTALTIGGAILFGVWKSNHDGYGSSYDDEWLLPVSLVTIGGGIACGALCFNSAHKIKKENAILSHSILQNDFQFSNGSSFSLGADLLRDNTLGQNTLGLGLRYNF